MGEIEEKGQALRSTLTAIREELGEAIFDKMLAALQPGEFRDAATSGRVLAASWYPIKHRRELYVALSSVTQQRGLPRRISKRATTDDMRGIYAFVIKLASASTLASVAPRVLATYFRGPSVSTVHLEPGHVRYQFKDFRGFDAALWEDMTSGIETILSLSGLERVMSEVEEADRGDGDSLISIRWKSI